MTKKSLEKVEIGYIKEYSEKYGDKLINIKSNPLKKPKKIEHSVNIENQKQLEERKTKLEETFVIKDDEKNKNVF